MKTGYTNRRERVANLNDQASKVWQSAYTRALGWSPDPDAEADKAMREFLARHGAS